MTIYVALLFSVVLTPQRRVAMADLKAMAEGLGLTNVRTLVSTGNLVFEAEGEPVSELERDLEAAFEATFGKHVDIICRDAASWKRLAAANPFPQESGTHPDRVGVRVMREPVTVAATARLRSRVAPAERLEIVDGDVWIVFGRDAGTSKLLSGLTHKSMGIGTSRNWNTVRRLAEILENAA